MCVCLCVLCDGVVGVLATSVGLGVDRDWGGGGGRGRRRERQTQTQKEPALRLGKPEGFSFARQIGRGGATSIGFACAASEQNRGSGVDTASKNNSHWNKSVFSVCLYIHKHTYYGTDFGHCQTMVQTLDTATCLGQDARGKASEGDVVEGG